MKSPYEILNEIKRLKKLVDEIPIPTVGLNQSVLLPYKLQAKLEALEWVLSEKS